MPAITTSRCRIFWKYRKEAATLGVTHVEHLKDYQECVAILIMCRVSKSVENVHAKLKEHGVERHIAQHGCFVEKNLSGLTPDDRGRR
jgi:hypothetical protein